MKRIGVSIILGVLGLAVLTVATLGAGSLFFNWFEDKIPAPLIPVGPGLPYTDGQYSIELAGFHYTPGSDKDTLVVNAYVTSNAGDLDRDLFQYDLRTSYLVNIDGEGGKVPAVDAQKVVNIDGKKSATRVEVTFYVPKGKRGYWWWTKLSDKMAFTILGEHM